MKNPIDRTSVSFNFDNSYSGLNEKLFTRLNPVAVKQPRTVLWNKALAGDLGITITDQNDPAVAGIFSGNIIPDGAQPLAQAYAGHQFGHFTMLGDGRAILLGEQITPDNRRLDIQFKGSGQTPYSRRGDGRATLYSMLREYLISEAMHHLRIPTSRSLAVVTTGEEVFRESVHQGAVLTRVASSHIRVGTFEYIRYLQPHLLSDFTGYVIKRHYPEANESENPPLELLRIVIENQARLVAQWMRVGFIHGVMNTDNTGIPVETFDYGPCAFINDYHPRKVFSSIDHFGRYAFGNQPGIMQWNLGCFAVTLLPLIDEDEQKATEKVKLLLEEYEELFNKEYLRVMSEKLGVEKPDANDAFLVEQLLNWMQQNQADYTNTFLDLEKFLVEEPGEMPEVYRQDAFQQWYNRWRQRIGTDKEKVAKAADIMRYANPAVIPRNHLVEDALDAAVNENYKPFQRMLKILSKPYERIDESAPFQVPPQDGDKNYQTFCGT